MQHFGMAGTGAQSEVTLDLMREALFDAYERLLVVWPQGDLRTFYAPLAETLTWITAVAQHMEMDQDPLFSGLAHARDRTLLGSPVVGLMSLDGDEERTAQPGENAPGCGLGTGTVWGFTREPEPPAPAPASEQLNSRVEHDAYDATLAGHSVESKVTRALHLLGVNPQALDLRPQPVSRRAHLTLVTPG